MIVGLVCARKDSSFRGKNLLKLGGKTLIEIAMFKARATCDRVIVSSDYPLSSIDIGDDTYIKRPLGLAGPRVPKWDVWKHAAGEVDDVTAIVDIDVSRPLTTVEDITGTIEAWQDAHGWRPPVAAMWKRPECECDIFEETGGNGCGMCLAHLDAPANRQDAWREWWGYGGIYIVGRHLFDEPSFHQWSHHTHYHEIPRAHCFDIDDTLDWEIVQDQYARQTPPRHSFLDHPRWCAVFTGMGCDCQTLAAGGCQ